MYTSGLDFQLANKINNTQTTGIRISPRQVNGTTFSFSATGEVLQLLEEVPGGVKVEWIGFTGHTDLSDGIVELTGVSRNLPSDTNSETGSGTGQAFSRGSTIRLVVDHRPLNFMPRTDRENTYTAKQTIQGGWAPPVFASIAARDAAFPSPWNGLWCIVTVTGVQQEHVYYNGTWNVTGIATPPPNASNNTKGVVDIATLAEIIARTALDATSGAPNVLTADNTIEDATGALRGKIVTLPASLAIPEVLGGTGKSSFTKGDILVATGATTLVKVPVGSNGQVLQADSAEASGVKWVTPTASGSRLLQNIHTGVNISGTTTETTLFTYTVPAGTMGINDVLRVRVWIKTNNSTATNSIRLKFGGANVFSFAYTTSTNLQMCVYDFEIRNTGSLTAQDNLQSMNRAVSNSSLYFSTTTINTAVDQVLSVSGQLASTLGGNLIEFDAATIEILK